MGDFPSAVQGRIHVDLAADEMSASVCLADGAGGDPVAEDDVLGALEEAGVVVDERVREGVCAYLGRLASTEPPTEPFVVAEGRPPFPGRDEELVWDESFQRQGVDWQKGLADNFYSLGAIAIVGKDAVIGTISPVVEPSEGATVKGRCVPAEVGGALEPLVCDDTIRRDPANPAKVIATKPGKVVQRGRSLGVEEVLEIAGDVGVETAHVESPLHVHVQGAICDRRELKSGGDVTVGMLIEAASVEAKGDVVVRGGIVGRNTGRVRAGGEVVAKFCTEANIGAVGPIKIANQIMSSVICTGQRLVAEEAAVVGGAVYSRDGLDVAVLGSDAGATTRIVAGLRPDVLIEAARAERREQPAHVGVERMRKIVQLLMERHQSMSNAQRGQTSELSMNAESLVGQLAESQQRREALVQSAYCTGKPTVRVSTRIYPGVSVRIGCRETVFNKELQGPVSIEERKIKNVTQMVAVNEQTHTIQVLKSQRLSTDDLLADYERDLAQGASAD